jgi:integrase
VPVRSIAANDIELLRASLSRTPYQANRVVALVSRLLSLCETWGWRDVNSNPARRIEKFKEFARETYLSDDDLKRVGVAMSVLVDQRRLSKSAQNALRLLLLTGARLNEILEAKIGAVDRERRVLHLATSKTGKRDIFLSGAALTVIDEQLTARGGVAGDHLFPGSGRNGAMVNLRKPWIRVCEEAGLEGVRLHDLRHTAASIAVREGAPLAIIGRVLGHSQAQTTKRYSHVGESSALAAVDLISGALSSVLNIPSARYVALT